MKTLLTLLLSSLTLTTLFAQRPGGPPPGGGPETMIAREKQAVFEKITDLSEDQKMLLTGIYDEFTVTLKEAFEENRNTDREARREKFQALRKEKNELIADVLNDDQYAIYESLAQRRRERKGPPRQDQD